ncbi:ArsA family ATPase [Smaragdicoccus niigatensis]|uniref:ArsA family ATPase n=1 Tax=Smaragdicoccus niigatensis TaxID=359359 RepID=UPI000477D680|nr:TRC40/GET3/ArsA family transport-energizing ATPase [Smaragdicoccus niigatensis]
MFLGKGGAGKSTLAAATAFARAAEGKHVLLASIDQAHSLTQILDLKTSHKPGQPSSIQRVDFGLDVLEIDTLALLEERYRNLVKLAGVGQALGQVSPVTPLDPREVAGLPGVEPILALAELAELVADDDWDVVIIDCPATAEAMSALTAPEILLGYLERMWPQEQRSNEALSAGLRTAMMAGGVERMSSTVKSVRSLLGDARRTSIHLVTTPDRVSFAELMRTRSAVALAGFRVSDIIVNRVVPESAAESSGWLASRRTQQQQVIAEIRAAISEIPVQLVDDLVAEPIGRAALESLSEGLLPPDEHIEVRSVSVVPRDGGTALRFFLPVADPRSVTLARISSDLIVGADGARRRIPLDPDLRACTVVGAEFDGQYLVVMFSAKS